MRSAPISVEATTIIGRLRIRTTEEVPDHDLSRRNRRNRRRQNKTRANAASTVAHVPAIAEKPAAVVSTPAAGFADTEPPPETVPEVATTLPEAMTPNVDLSSPIKAFEPAPAESLSPIHRVAVPASIEGTMLDPESPDDSAAAPNEASSVSEFINGDAPQAADSDPAQDADLAPLLISDRAAHDAMPALPAPTR